MYIIKFRKKTKLICWIVEENSYLMKRMTLLNDVSWWLKISSCEFYVNCFFLCSVDFRSFTFYIVFIDVGPFRMLGWMLRRTQKLRTESWSNRSFEFEFVMWFEYNDKALNFIDYPNGVWYFYIVILFVINKYYQFIDQNFSIFFSLVECRSASI